MFKHILLPTDGSKLSDTAVKQAIAVAKAFGAKITALHIVGSYHLALSDDGYPAPEIPALKKRFEEEGAARAKKILAPIKEAAKIAGIECDVTCSGMPLIAQPEHEATTRWHTC